MRRGHARLGEDHTVLLYQTNTTPYYCTALLLYRTNTPRKFAALLYLTILLHYRTHTDVLRKDTARLQSTIMYSRLTLPSWAGPKSASKST